MVSRCRKSALVFFFLLMLSFSSAKGSSEINPSVFSKVFLYRVTSEAGVDLSLVWSVYEAYMKVDIGRGEENESRVVRNMSSRILVASGMSFADVMTVNADDAIKFLRRRVSFCRTPLEKKMFIREINLAAFEAVLEIANP